MKHLIISSAILLSLSACSVLPDFSWLIGSEHQASSVASGDANHSLHSDFFFQVVFVATAMSIVSGAVAERMKLTSFLIFSIS